MVSANERTSFMQMSEIEAGKCSVMTKGSCLRLQHQQHTRVSHLTPVTGCYQIVAQEWSDIAFSAGMCFWLPAAVCTTRSCSTFVPCSLILGIFSYANYYRRWAGPLLTRFDKGKRECFFDICFLLIHARSGALLHYKIVVTSLWTINVDQAVECQ